MSYNEQYYSEKKKDLQEQIGILIGETYYEIERMIAQKIKKQKFLEEKIIEIETREAEEKVKNEKEKPAEDKTVK